MKKIFLGVLLTTCIINLRSQNSFGETSYPHSDVSIVSCGMPSRDPGARGFIIAGYDPQSTSYNFTIDRTNTGGFFASAPYEFQNAYQLSADTTASCNSLYNLNSCWGVTFVETSISSNTNIALALAGSSDHGLFLSFINANGSAAGIDYFFRWVTGPSPSSTIGKVFIVQAAGLYLGTWEHYWICSSKDGIVYLIDVSVNGVLINSLAYQINAVASDLTLNSAGDPVIVGTATIPGNMTDGFLIQVDQTLYTITSFYTYDVAGEIQRFNCVHTMANGAFLVGGYCDDGSSPEHAWMLQVLNVWPYSASDLLCSLNSDSNAGDVVAVTERYNTSLAFENYGVLTTTLGIVVIKLTAALAAWTAPPGNEFPINTAGNSMFAADMDFFNTSTTMYDEGLHVFGTNNNVSPPENYLSQLYFNGINSCNTVDQFTGSSVFPLETSRTATGATPLSLCTQASLSDSPDGSRTAVCGPVTSDIAGSNNKPSQETKINKNSTFISPMKIFPNPCYEKIVCSGNFDQSTELNAIRIINMEGQNFEITEFEIGSDKNLILDISKMHLKNGIYFLKMELNKQDISSTFVIE